MPSGPGKYDDACTTARTSTGAEGVVLIVVNGHQGSGFSVQFPPRLIATLPDVLEGVAQEIRASQKGQP